MKNDYQEILTIIIYNAIRMIHSNIYVNYSNYSNNNKITWNQQKTIDLI